MSIPQPEHDDEYLPSRLVMLPWGSNETVSEGAVIVNETTLAQLEANQVRSNRKRVAIDFSHNSVEGSPTYKGEPVALAGYADVSVVPGEGLVFSNISWTKEGLAQADNYRELSAAVGVNARGEVIWVHSGAICRHGQVRDLKLHATRLSSDFFSPTDPTTMNERTLLLHILGLSAEATDDAVETAAKAFLERMDNQAQQLTTLSTDLDALRKSVATAEAGDDAVTVVALTARIEALEALDEQRERAAIRAEALRQGKLVPLSADKLTLEQYRTLVSELPAGVVPVERRTPEGLKALSSDMSHPGNAAEEEVRQRMGISKEAWAKHKAAR